MNKEELCLKKNKEKLFFLILGYEGIRRGKTVNQKLEFECQATQYEAAALKSF